MCSAAPAGCPPFVFLTLLELLPAAAPDTASYAGRNSHGQLGVGGTADVHEPQTLQVRHACHVALTEVLAHAFLSTQPDCLEPCCVLRTSQHRLQQACKALGLPSHRSSRHAMHVAARAHACNPGVQPLKHDVAILQLASVMLLATCSACCWTCCLSSLSGCMPTDALHAPLYIVRW